MLFSYQLQARNVEGQVVVSGERLREGDVECVTHFLSLHDYDKSQLLWFCGEEVKV